jgi:phenylpropionate dioxygenase-like ring-hydroxylating dioxygenase large terminal subunit
MMATQEENELLTRTGPGTPAGDLLRRYWQPVALAEELPPGGPPLPVRILGEDLVLFRDEEGRPGLLGLHCSHRGADLSYGRLEDGGLRCIYHGWLYDVHGHCLEQPGEPAGSTFHERIRHPAYPCQEAGGMILTYMGPADPPLLPPYEFLLASEERLFARKELKECNYLQGNEGNIDPQHLGVLHWTAGAGPMTTVALHARGPKMVIETEETDFGVRLYHQVPVDRDTNYVKITNFIFPNLAAFESSSVGELDGYGVNWHVPIDDTHHWGYTIFFDRKSSVDRVFMQRRGARAANYERVRTRANRYLQDREEMKTESFAGLGIAFSDQDACAIEGQPIQDWTREHLGPNDRAIIAARAMLLRAVRDVQAGREPPHLFRDPASCEAPNIVVTWELIPSSVDWRAHLKNRTRAPVEAVRR